MFDINLNIPDKVTALIGPSGCGKSTFLRTLNRMNETIAVRALEGEILLDDQNILGNGRDQSAPPRRYGFPAAQSFPKSIFDNVAYGLRINGLQGRPIAERPRRAQPAGAPRCGMK